MGMSQNAKGIKSTIYTDLERLKYDEKQLD